MVHVLTYLIILVWQDPNKSKAPTTGTTNLDRLAQHTSTYAPKPQTLNPKP